MYLHFTRREMQLDCIAQKFDRSSTSLLHSATHSGNREFYLRYSQIVKGCAHTFQRLGVLIIKEEGKPPE